MIFFYFWLIIIILIVENWVLVWLIIEFGIVFFFLFVLRFEVKRFGLIVYYFLQSIRSLILFLVMFYFSEWGGRIILLIKLGVFPFFYWLVVVRVRVGYWRNIFILIFQKIRVLWMFWLVNSLGIDVLVILVYINLFFVFVTLIGVRDLWLLLVYSSIGNTALVLVGVGRHIYIYIVRYYLVFLFGVVWCVKSFRGEKWRLRVIFFLIVRPPFFLFYFKLIIFLRIGYMLLVVILLRIFDVMVMIYYFRIIFFFLIIVEERLGVRVINLVIGMRVLMLRICGTLDDVN